MNPAFLVRRQAMPAPALQTIRPLPLIVVDQGLSDWPDLLRLLPTSMQARVLTLHAGLPQLAAWLAEKPAGSVSELHLL